MRTRDRSKKGKIENESSQVTSETTRYVEDSIPSDLVFEILRRLPVKSVARFLLVSKLWVKIIRSQDFIRLFPLPSSLQPRQLLAFKCLDNENERQIWKFFSSTSTTSMMETLSYLSLATCPIANMPKGIDNYVNEVPHYVNGLISLGCGREQIICNPSTGTSITLPKVKSRKKIIRSFFGYDPVDGQYKVLCMSEKLHDYWHAPSVEHQVFTLGGVNKSWRMIECNILHRAKTNGVCINGVVYYGAWMIDTSVRECVSKKKWCLARFDVRSEKFDQVVQILGVPFVRNFHHPSLISYKGKASTVSETKRQRFELWVLEDAEKHEWSKVCFFIHHPLIDSWGPNLRIRGYSIHTDEIVFVSHDHQEDFYILYYQQNKSFRCFTVKGYLSTDVGRFTDVFPFFNYEETVMFL
ncbi:PREDICTED: putative F-box protein At1g31000 [Camelina sativa]|uniref:F-box protein At1g31000 n=1 Tax=Camelina sativa TaxID=90675 RepID=A0ABM0TUL8_CAMSA|nr:PREDICTED: putative F-box protein At1g31000 [Camelina sativa]